MTDTDGPEFVLAPWDDGDTETETEVVTVELPSRNIIAQVETPVEVLEGTVEMSEQYDASFERVLAERLEVNMARVYLFSARAGNRVEAIRANLKEAKALLADVEHLETDDVESEIESVWAAQLS